MWVRFPPGVPKNDECNFAFVIFLRSLVNQPRSSIRRQPYSCRGAPACGKRQIPATVDNAKLRQFCIRHFLVISRESTPFVNAAAAVFLPGDSRLRETANSRPPVDNAKLRQFCIRHFVFHCDGGVTLTPRKTTLPETHPSATPRPSMQWKANY